MRAMAWRTDRATFTRSCGFEPDERQLEVLRSTAPQVILLCTRQWGKSTVTANLALYEAILAAPALVLIFARAQRQAIELLRKVKEQVGTLGTSAPALVNDNEMSVEFETGSRILALPGTEANVRGFSGPSLVIFDEAARVPDELYYAARPMLATSQGRLILLSSAWDVRGFFYTEWDQGDPTAWHKVKVTAPECPRLDPAWLQRERATVGERVYRREYLCQFGQTEETVFPRELVLAALDPTIPSLFGSPQ
ncbi:MAG TPA: terminase family protein [Gemmatimonadaceae bacterium]|nr:terminase family protein [Gemmatimonadaceae bacterium]